MQRRDGYIGYLFVLPAVLGFLTFVAGPLVYVFSTSTQNYNTFTGQSSFVGIGNYEQLATSGVFATVLLNTAIFSLAVIPANIILGLLLAMLVNHQIPGMAIFRTAYFIPAVVSMVAWSLVWNYLLQGRGGMNAALEAIGISGPNWLADPKWALASVIGVQVLKTTGIAMVIFLAALQDVPEEVIQAATVDGANGRQIFGRVTLPLISPSILLVAILATITSLQSFAQVFLLTKGGPGYSTSILGYYIYDQAFGAFQFGTASAAAVVLFVVVLGVTLLQWRLRRRWVYNES